MSKRIISTFLVFCMVLGMVPNIVPVQRAAAAVVSFSDVSGHWAQGSIEKLAQQEIVQGSGGLFSPDANITRGEVATIFNNLMGYQVVADNKFSDLPAGQWYTTNMLKANAAGIFSGDGSGTMNPQADITRQEFFVTLANLLALSDSSVSGKFSDQGSIPDWAAPKLNALAGAGFLTGVSNADGTYRADPGRSITRAEVSTLMSRAFPGIYKNSGTQTQSVSGNAVVSVPKVTLSAMKVTGDLFIAPGVANGEATLDGVTVSGRTLIAGGGKNSFIAKGNSVLDKVTAAKNAASDPISLKFFGKTVVNHLTIVANSAKTAVLVNDNAVVKSIVVDNADTTISGIATVNLVTINADNVAVNTPGTKVVVAGGVTGTTVDGKAVLGGTTITSAGAPVIGGGSGSDSASDGDGGNGGGTTPIPPNEGYTVTYQTNGGEALAPTVVAFGKKLDPVPQARKADAIFLGWYTTPSLELGQQFYASDALTGNITLYAKYSNMEKNQQQKVDSFALSDQDPNKTFAIKAPGLNADQVKTRVTITTIGAGGVPELVVQDNGNGNFTISAKDGFREGSAITLNLGDGLSFGEKDGEGNEMSADIRNASFTVKKELVNDLKLNSKMAEVQSTVIADLVPTDNPETENVVENKGTFTYNGNTSLAEGDLMAIYTTTAPADRGTGDYSDDPITYVKVIGVSDDGKQVTYVTPDTKSVISAPESLPLDSNKDFVAGSYTGKGDHNFEIATADLAGLWADYTNIGLSADTTLDVGDTVVIVGLSTAPDAEVATGDVVYGTVDIVTVDGSNTVVTFTETTMDAIMSNTQDYYTEQAPDYGAIAEAAMAAGITDQIEKQALESGFAEQAVNYMAGVATQTEGFKEAASRSGGDTVIDLPSFGDDWDPNINIPSFVTKGFKVEAKITENTDHFGEDGLMCQLFVTGTVKVPLSASPLPDYLEIDLTATFQQELKIKVNVDGGIQWKLAAFIPYPADFYMNTNVDVYNYTGVAVHAIVGTKGGGIDLGGLGELKDLDISKEIEDLLGLQEAEQMAGSQKLMDMYAEMLQKETDYITLVEQEIFDIGIAVDPMGLLKVGINANFVIKANVNLVLGSSISYECGNRYNFWFGLFSGESGSSNTQLIDEKMKFQFYVMGMIGLKIGVVMDIYVAFNLPKDLKGGTFEVASTGIEIESGAYVELYGYFVYTIESLNKVAESEMSGALYVDFGIYLEISFFARLADGIASYQPMLYDHKWPLLSAGDRINVYDFTYPAIEAEDKYYIKNYTTDYLPDTYWSMKGMDLMEGDLVDVIYPRDKFVYTMSNKNFTFDLKTGKVSVNVPTNMRYMECDMTVTWTGAKLAFSTSELRRTIHLVWTNLDDQEMSLRHNISVVAGDKVIWSKVVGEGEEYTLPDAAELSKLLDFGNAYKYENGSALTYTNEQGTADILNADRDRIYTVNVTPRNYDLVVKDVQQADGTTQDLTLTASYGEQFDLTQLLASGRQNPKLQNDDKTPPYTTYAKTTTPEPDATEDNPKPTGAKPIDAVIDTAFAKQLEANKYVYTAVYKDNSLKATYNFVDSRGKLLDTEIVKVERDNYPDFDYQSYAKTMVPGTTYMVKDLDKAINKLTANETYTAVCVIASGDTADITFGGDDVTLDALPRYTGAHLTLPRPVREGYTFAGWFMDEDLTEGFTDTHMPGTAATMALRDEATEMTKIVTPDDTVKPDDTVTTNGNAKMDKAIWLNKSVRMDAVVESEITGKEDESDKKDESVKEDESGKKDESVKEDESGKKDEPVKQEEKAKVREVVTPASASSLNLYAGWTANQYKVTFDVNAPGASVSGTPKAETVTFGESYGTLPNDLRRRGYILSGWFTEKAAGSSTTNVTTVLTSTDHTLYAMWTPKELIEDSYFTNFKATGETPGEGEQEDDKIKLDYDKIKHPYPLALSSATPDPTDPMLASFFVSYKGKNRDYTPNKWLSVIPKDAEEYDVLVYRPEDDSTQMYKRVVVDGVVINQIKRPDTLTIAPPTKATDVTFNSVTVNPGTVTAVDPADAEDGVVQYRMETWSAYKNNDGATVLHEQLGDKTKKWTDSLTLQSDVQNGDGVVQQLTVRKIYTQLAGGRNYEDLTNEVDYLTLETKEPLKDASKEQPATIEVAIKTSSAAFSDTDSAVLFELLGHGDKSAYTTQLDNANRNDFMLGQVDRYSRTLSLDPWMMNGQFRILLNGTDAWKYTNLDYKIGTVKGTFEKQIEEGTALGDWAHKDYTFADAELYKRSITNVGGFAQWGGEYSVDVNATGTIDYTYDGMITDQYGTYNAYEHSDAPAIKVANSAFNDTVSYSNYGLSIDKAKLYKKMLAAERDTVTFTVELAVPVASRSNPADDEMFIKTITITRK